MRVQDALISIRQQSGLNKNVFANALHIARSQITFYESGKRKPSIMTIVKYSRYATANGYRFELNELEE